MAEAGGNAASIANTPWWELLKDQELQKLIRTALEENKDLQRAAAARMVSRLKRMVSIMPIMAVMESANESKALKVSALSSCKSMA